MAVQEETYNGTDAAGNPVTLKIIIPGPGPARKGATFTKWGTCATCLFEFPLSELSEINGKLYCSRNGCDSDFKSLR